MSQVGFWSRNTVSRGYCSHLNGKPITSPSGFAGPPKYWIVPVPLPNGAAGTEHTHAAGAWAAAVAPLAACGHKAIAETVLALWYPKLEDEPMAGIDESAAPAAARDIRLRDHGNQRG